MESFTNRLENFSAAHETITRTGSNTWINNIIKNAVAKKSKNYNGFQKT